jgi:endonuclease-8
MPEGDTLHRTADGLRPFLAGRTVTAVTARTPGPQAERLIGRKIETVEAVGKNVLVRFDGGLEIRTHLGMHGTWHRYRPGETWRRPAKRARLVIEVPGAVAVCFDAPVVELVETRAESVHPVLGKLGPDLLDGSFDDGRMREIIRRFRDATHADRPVADVLLDQRVLAGIGNVYKSEILWIEKVDPFARVGTIDDAALGRVIWTARRLMLANADREGGPERVTTTDDPAADGPLYVYRRTGRPCRRCGAPIESRKHGSPPRTTYWCPSPTCQGSR